MLQAIGLLDDLDKELNTYAMRLREWYGWHFPELGKIVPDHQMYAKALMKMGVRTSCKSLDFSDILPEEVELEMKDAAEISMGTEVSEDDIANILQLCDQVVSLSEYRAQLWDYLRNRMQVHPLPAALIGQPLEANPRPTHAHARTPHATPSHTRAMTRYMQWESLLCTLTRHLLWFLEPAATRTTRTQRMHTPHARRMPVACIPHMHTVYTPYACDGACARLPPRLRLHNIFFEIAVDTKRHIAHWLGMNTRQGRRPLQPEGEAGAGDSAPAA